MVFSGIEGVDPDGVRAQLCQVWNVSLTTGRIGERVDISIGTVCCCGCAIAQIVLLKEMLVCAFERDLIWSQTLVGNALDETAQC